MAGCEAAPATTLPSVISTTTNGTRSQRCNDCAADSAMRYRSSAAACDGGGSNLTGSVLVGIMRISGSVIAGGRKRTYSRRAADKRQHYQQRQCGPLPTLSRYGKGGKPSNHAGVGNLLIRRDFACQSSFFDYSKFSKSSDCNGSDYCGAKPDCPYIGAAACMRDEETV